MPKSCHGPNAKLQQKDGGPKPPQKFWGCPTAWRQEGQAGNYQRPKAPDNNLGKRPQIFAARGAKRALSCAARQAPDRSLRGGGAAMARLEIAMHRVLQLSARRSERADRPLHGPQVVDRPVLDRLHPLATGRAVVGRSWQEHCTPRPSGAVRSPKPGGFSVSGVA